MPRHTRLALAATTLALAVACQGDQPTMPPVGPLSATISDGTDNAGNPDFFFLSPISSPGVDPDFRDRAFNAALTPVVDVCELSGDPTAPPPAVVTCGSTVFGPVAAQVSAQDEHYLANWPTDASNNGRGLDVAKFYRIQVFASAGGQRLGFADVDPVSNGRELRSVATGLVVGLVNGRTLPIKFRIEAAALCDPPGTQPCSSAAVNLAQGGTVVLEGGEGDRVDIPPQTGSSQVIAVTLQRCDGIDVDLPKFGNCLTIRADPALGAALVPRAVVSMCSLDQATLGLTEAQERLVTLHRQDDATILALPHARDFCGTAIGQTDRLPPARNLAAAGWRVVRRVVRAVFGARPVYAATALLDVGGGGETSGFSDFQFALPAKMDIIKGTTGFQTLIGTAVPAAPAVMVTDLNGDPVAGARVTFSVTAGDGTLNGGGTSAEALSTATGVASLSSWTVGAQPARNTVLASGRGIADPVHNGPRPSFDPFAPDITLPTADQSPVPVGLGSLEFSAFGATPTTTILRSAAPLTVFGAPLTLTAVVSSAPPPSEEPIVEFLDGTRSLGLAATNGSGAATLDVSDLSLTQHTLSARFLGSATRFASTSDDVTEHVIRRFDDLASFTAALGGAATESQNLDGIAAGTAISTLIPGVLDVSSTFDTLQVHDCSGSNAVFGFDNSTRQAGNGRYDLLFGAARNALAFDVTSQDPATGPAQVEVQTGGGTATFPVRNLSGSETTPTFLGMIASIALDRVLIHEGPEVGGTVNEEICLDSFLTGSVPLP